MDKTLRQVTDGIHGTIYLSELESSLISTPYFYRLHDIYQSSTVYMTFPSNRTKRYEHSLGTMELASSMLFSSVSNADNETKKLLFQQLDRKFKSVLNLAIFNTQSQSAAYFSQISNIINRLFESINIDDEDNFLKLLMKNYITPSIIAGDFSDSAMEQYQYYPMGFEDIQNSDNAKNFFLYRCLLEAVRIVALFHDVGHPPYSHIIEEVLHNLYDECNCENSCNVYDKSRIKRFNACILQYATEEENKAYQCNTLISKSSLIDAHLHERIGLSLLQSAILYVVPNMIQAIFISSKEEHYKISIILYYIMVVEMASAILVENDMFFKSFHKIVDGVIDADRLDYIMRDSINSGVDWGQIPYKRLINSAKLFNLSLCEKTVDSTNNDIFVIAYPKKVSEDIEDLLLMRYKIFARINFHHRCMKTAVTLQSTVMDIARDYLSKNSDDNCVNSAIQVLWSSLDNKAGERSIRIIQWNDSWLISVLHKALVNIINNNLMLNNNLLKENLEEILLNKKKYYSLIKRGVDSQRLVEKIFEFADITKEGLNELKRKEQKKYYSNLSIEVTEENILDNPKSDGRESIIRCNEFLEAIDRGDLELLDNMLPLPDKNIVDIFNDILTEQKNMNYIIEYKIIVNTGRGKLGLPDHKDKFGEIYLYDKKDMLIHFDENKTLFQQIKAIEKNVPWIYVYIIPPKNCVNIQTLFDTIKEVLAKGVGSEIKKRFNELFGKLNQ